MSVADDDGVSRRSRDHAVNTTGSGSVGYEGLSPFNRKFKRLFGLPPAEELARMKGGGIVLKPEEELFIPA